jgi:hypothetical protein
MTMSCRSWWQNCALKADAEILEIDKMEDKIAPISPPVSKIRELISTLELCHFKSERRVNNIIRAIGTGRFKTDTATSSANQYLHIKKGWQNACAALSAWCAGCPNTAIEIYPDANNTSQILASLGARSPLKEWQVQRVIEKIQQTIFWPQSAENPAAHYEWILLEGDEYGLSYRTECPIYYQEHQDFWLETVRTIIFDTENGKNAELSLGLAIDMLWPCHWGFLENLQIVIAAIGGKLFPERPFAACGRNIKLLPINHRMGLISNTLRIFCGDSGANKGVDRRLLENLGTPTRIKKWLAASLDKTIRLQLNPPAELQAISALTTPAWIKQ